MNENPFELPDSRLASTTETGKRLYIFPAKVAGFFRTYRTWVYHFLILIFLVLPWIHINGTPLILLDIPHRKFSLFGITFWGHEAPLLFLVFVTFILLITVITTAFGRIWCGWACPQTVFIDGWFRRIEEWIEGAGLTRKRYENQPMSLKKFLKKFFKWTLFLGLSLVITHSFLAYFVGSDRVLEMIQHNPHDNMTSFLVIFFSTGIILFNFGWFREQFCIIACPYGRFQSVVMDEDSLVVAYDVNRGEPRRKDFRDTDAKGDCINCYRCVQVCPTGVDIRRGTQLECIMCTACIDACNTVMEKLNKPKGLIRYDTEHGINREKKRFFRPRLVIYLSLFIIFLSAFIVMVNRRSMIDTHFLRAANPPYKVMDDSSVLNQFTITIHNQFFTPITVDYGTDLADVSLVAPLKSMTLEAGETVHYILFATVPLSYLKDGKFDLTLNRHVVRNGEETIKPEEVTIIGPLSY